MIIPHNRLLKPPLGAPLDKKHRLSKGLVGCWVMNEGSGNVLYDLSGNGMHLTGNGGPTWTVGEHGPVILLDDGSGQYFERQTSIITAPPMTLFTRFLQDAEQTGYLIYIGDAATNEDACLINALGTLDDIDVAHRTTGGSAVDATVRTLLEFLQINEWNSVAGVFHGDSFREAYVNGVFAGSNSTTVGTSNPYNRISIGRRGRLSGGGELSGQISYSYLYNRVLSASEIAQLHHEPFAMVRERNENAIMGSFVSVVAEGNPWNYYAQIA